MAAFGLGGLAPRAAAAAETPAHPLAERLAAYADALRYADVDGATIEAVKSHLIDTLGCAIAAFDERPVRICREVAGAIATPNGATIIGTERRVSPDLAAFANGAAARYHDLNDVYVSRLTIHPSDTIGGCLAIAETERASAEGLITAIVLAYEINCRLLDAFDITKRGWDAPIFGLPAGSSTDLPTMSRDRTRASSSRTQLSDQENRISCLKFDFG
jgi:2-methylcitrate dehydratase